MTYQHTVQTMVSGFDFSKKWCTLADVGNVLDPMPVSRRLVVVTVLEVVVTAIVANGTLPTPACAGFGVVHAAGIVVSSRKGLALGTISDSIIITTTFPDNADVKVFEFGTTGSVMVPCRGMAVSIGSCYT